MNLRLFTRSLTTIALTLFSFMGIVKTGNAETLIYSGKPSTILVDTLCNEKPDITELIFVFDKGQDGIKSGWMYGERISTTRFNVKSVGKYDADRAVSAHYKLPTSSMELKPIKGGYRATILDYIPEDKELRKDIFFCKILVVNLRPKKGSADKYIDRAKVLYSSELILLEGMDLAYKQKDYRGAEAKGYEALKMIEPLFGKNSKESFSASGLISLALALMERYDEALEIIAPYVNSMPNDDVIKDFVKDLEIIKKEQDELFKSDPDSNVEMPPVG